MLFSGEMAWNSCLFPSYCRIRSSPCSNMYGNMAADEQRVLAAERPSAMRRGPRRPPVAAAVALLAILSTTDGGIIPRVHGGGPCTSDDDCQLNGRCVGGKCACLAAWEGANCSLLATRPSDSPAHAMLNVSSWGGRSYFWEGDGLWHGTTATMPPLLLTAVGCR